MLLRHGIDQFHFYTLNRSELTDAVCRLVTARAGGASAAA
jgi:hypothetical protein